MATPQVTIVGVKALLRDLQKAGEPTGALIAAVKQAGVEAVTPVADAARAVLPRVDTSTHPAGTLAGDIRVSATKTGAKVRMGRASIRYAGPVEFGGYPPGRAYLPQGRYLFPAAARLGPEAARTYSDALEAALARMGWTNQTTDPGSVHD
jgi:hypothetical protein